MRDIDSIKGFKSLIMQAADRVVSSEKDKSFREALHGAVDGVLSGLDNGELSICEYIRGEWQVNEWLKQAILLAFRLKHSRLMTNGQGYAFDKMPLKFADWNEAKFLQAGFRVVPGAVVRYASYIAKNVVLMPSFVNIGAYIDEGTLIDSWVTVGSCARIGKNCHISSNTTIAGVLEPLQARPVVIEDKVFIGAGSSIAEGVVVKEGAVVAAGISITASTKILDRATHQVTYGYIPPYSVVVPGVEPVSGTAAVIIVKQVDAHTRGKISINELLRGDSELR